MTNSNCLEGIRCPQCGNEENFRIEAVIVCHVTDEGSEPTGDHHWDKDSFCHCPECEHDGKLRDFFIPMDEREAAVPPETTKEGIPMKQQVDVTLKLSLWLDATMDEDDIVTHVRASLPKAFGEELTAMENPVDIIGIRQEAEIYGNEDTAACSVLATLQRAEFLLQRISEGDHRALENAPSGAAQCRDAIRQASRRTA